MKGNLKRIIASAGFVFYLTVQLFAVPSAADMDTPAELTVSNRVLRLADEVPPIGINQFGDSGGNEYAANNMIRNPGNEPISFRGLFRVTEAGDNWFEIDNGGASHWECWGSGFLSGARVRIYRIVDENGAPQWSRAPHGGLSRVSQRVALLGHRVFQKTGRRDARDDSSAL